MQRCAAWAVVGLLFVSACDGLNFDLAAVPFPDGGDVDVELPDGDMAQPPHDMPPSDAADVPDPPDSGDLTDTGPPDDAGDVDVRDLPDAPDMDAPSTCGIPHPIDATKCHPLEEGKCPENGLCNLAFVGTLQLSCLPRNTEGTLGRDAPCTGASDCVEHLTCFNWSAPTDPDPRGRVCSQFCVLETNEGCGPDEFCTGTASVPDVEGIGWCTPRCDPYDADSCAMDQTCSIDFNYPGATCEPEFRCVRLTGAKLEGEECGPGARVAECSHGLTCYEPAVGDYQCVRPCQTDADCTSGTCGAPAGPWSLKWCQ